MHFNYDPLYYRLQFPQWLERAADFFSTLLSERQGPLIALENVAEPTPYIALRLLEKAGQPRLVHCFDFGHHHVFARVRLRSGFSTLIPGATSTSTSTTTAATATITWLSARQHRLARDPGGDPQTALPFLHRPGAQIGRHAAGFDRLLSHPFPRGRALSAETNLPLFPVPSHAYSQAKRPCPARKAPRGEHEAYDRRPVSWSLPFRRMALASGSSLAFDRYHSPDENRAGPENHVPRPREADRAGPACRLAGSHAFSILYIGPEAGRKAKRLPAILVAANMEGTVPLASEAALFLAQAILDKPECRQDKGWYILPLGNPDAAANYFSKPLLLDSRNRR